jgi:predicted nucleic acid-binding protein
MLVADASVLIAAGIDSGPAGVWAEEALSRGGIIAPHLVMVETANILRRFELAGKLERLEASAALQDILGMGIQLVPFQPFAERIWALRANITTSYDAWYVAIAEQMGLPLATLDRKLAQAPGTTCEFLQPSNQ